MTERDLLGQEIKPPKSRVAVKIVLLGFLAFVGAGAYKAMSDPLRRIYDDQYWQHATLESVQDLPDEVLAPGNRNGAVLMWAAAGTTDPDVITALVKRGAEINEVDPVFQGTALSAAASDSVTPAVIDRMIEHGADINQRVGRREKSVLMIAAEVNDSQAVIKRLIHHGADVGYKDTSGDTAYENAKKYGNQAGIEVLAEYEE